MSRKLFKAAGSVASMTFISRLLGLIREMVFASTFGAGAAMDAFLVAFKIPNFMRRLFAEGAFTQAFVPVLSDEQAKNDPHALRDLVSRTLGTLMFVVGLVTLLGMLFSSTVISVFAPGLRAHPVQFDQAAVMLQLTFPYLWLITMTALFSAVLNVLGRFALPAFTPVLLNISMIAAAWGAHTFLDTPIYALALGVLIGGVLQWLCLWPALMKRQLLVWPKWGGRDPKVRRIGLLMLPILLSGSVAQISLLMDVFFASFLPSGGISWLYYSDRLIQFPLGLIGVTVATISLPKLSARYAANDQQGFKKTFNWCVQCLVLLCLPASMGLFCLALPLTATMYHRGAFTQLDAMMSSYSLMAMALGLMAFVLARVLVTVFYAQKNTRQPVKYAIICLVLNIILNALLIKPFGHVGLAAATSLSSLLHIILLSRGLYTKGVVVFCASTRTLIAKVLLACLFMAICLTMLTPAHSIWLEMKGFTRAAYLCGEVSLGACVYAATLWFLRVPLKQIMWDKS